jgi:hypothetical protein
MLSGRIRSTSCRRLPWLLWLGVLFAFAQGAASAHAISHLGQDPARSRDLGFVHAQCDLCLLGASIGGAAPAPEPAPTTHPAIAAALVDDEAAPLLAAALALAYRSRAPPPALR